MMMMPKTKSHARRNVESGVMSGRRPLNHTTKSRRNGMHEYQWRRESVASSAVKIERFLIESILAMLRRRACSRWKRTRQERRRKQKLDVNDEPSFGRGLALEGLT